VKVADLRDNLDLTRIAAPTARSSATPPATVFTDTALFRRVCAQADSGLTIAVRRCTPRDPGLRVP
jgi:hypothetical protein